MCPCRLQPESSNLVFRLVDIHSLLEILKGSYHTSSVKRILADPGKSTTKKLIELYSMESPIYRVMNAALRNNDAPKLRFCAGYIRRLRDLFRVDKVRQNDLVPYEGYVYRGLGNLPPQYGKLEDLEASLWLLRWLP